MKQQFTNHLKAHIAAPVEKVWKALTDSAMIRDYFFGVEASGEWKPGNTITYNGEWQGKPYHGKAQVLEVVPFKKLKHTYWSDLSGSKDRPENHHIITYDLTRDGDFTQINLTEENLDSEEMKQQSAGLWEKVFENMDKLLR